MPTLDALREKERELTRVLRELRKFTGGKSRSIDDIRSSERERKSRERAAAKAIAIPPCADRERRERLEQDVFAWLPYYLPDVFSDAFQSHHVEMIQAILSAASQAGDQAIAGPRGEGKTTNAEGVAVYCILRGIVSFVVIFAATGTDARNSLASIKQYIATSDRLLEDYPEVCVPIREVDAVPNRAHSILVSGSGYDQVEARFQWSGDEITMPRVPGSVCSGAIIATRGLDAAVRGLKKGTKRPQLVLIDDPDTEDTARNPEQADKLATRIDRGIAGLAPRGKRLSRVMLTTLQNRICVSYRYTDPQQKPSWNGKRFAFMLAPPTCADLWDEYISLRQQGQASGDQTGRKAHAHYLAHRTEMDAGAVLANPHSFDGRTLADGTQLQVSALQRYYDFVADNGIGSALSELQNAPPDESGPQESKLTAHRIMKQVSGYAKREIPPLCVKLTQGIDVGKYLLRWVVRAWREDGTGFTIDYGYQEVVGTVQGKDEGLDEALLRALHERRDYLQAHPYLDPAEQPVPVDMTLVDAGWRTEAVYRFCREAGLGYRPAMGFGRSSGCVQTNWTAPVRSSADKKVGERWFLSRKPKGVWLVCADADHWKAWEHDRWMTEPPKPGAMTVFGESGDGDRMSDDQKSHLGYAKSIVAEIEVEEVIKGVLRRYWKAKSDNNHFLDASYMSDVAASMLGISLMGPKLEQETPKQGWFAAQEKRRA